jgi:transposase
MFVRVKRSVQNGITYEYLQIVESFRERGKPRQRVLATLGKRDVLVASGALDGLLQSIARFSEKLRVVEAVRTQGIAARSSKLWGPPLVFGRLWEHQGLPEILQRLARSRRFGFEPERVIFAMALQRLCCPGSDLQGSGWIRTVEASGFETIELQHLYRMTGFLAEVRDDLERELFDRDRDLFTQSLDLVFIDTTSIYVYRAEETEWRLRGYSRDHRPDLPQLVLAVAVDRHGWPVSWEVFPGNTADHNAFEAMIQKMRQRFRIRRVIIVADRGMISQRAIKDLEDPERAPYGYILGCRMRKQKEVRQAVLSRGGRYAEVGSKLKVKEVWVKQRRYILCLNEEEAEKDAAAREAILERLRKVLEQRGNKALVGNRGFARFVKMQKGSVRIDEQAVEQDARFDGKFVLTTNTELSAEEVARTYKGLWRVERTFRHEKSTLKVRPLFHHRDDTSIGHIAASFLALRLEVDLQRRLEQTTLSVSWPGLMHDLMQLHAVRVELDGHNYLLRTDLQGAAYQAFAAAGLRPPPPLTGLD